MTTHLTPPAAVTERRTPRGGLAVPPGLPSDRRAASDPALPPLRPHPDPAFAAHLEPTLDPRHALGAWGEGLTARYLLDLGWEIVARNWRCEHGEVDLLARDGGVLVVVEVKTRSTAWFGDPLEQVTREKAARLRRLAVAAARAFGDARCPLRVDVVGVQWRPDGPARVRHVRAVGS